jgi:hypothetical protein
MPGFCGGRTFGLVPCRVRPRGAGSGALRTGRRSRGAWKAPGVYSGREAVCPSRPRIASQVHPLCLSGEPTCYSPDNLTPAVKRSAASPTARWVPLMNSSGSMMDAPQNYRSCPGDLRRAPFQAPEVVEWRSTRPLATFRSMDRAQARTPTRPALTRTPALPSTSRVRTRTAAIGHLSMDRCAGSAMTARQRRFRSARGQVVKWWTRRVIEVPPPAQQKPPAAGSLPRAGGREGKLGQSPHEAQRNQRRAAGADFAPLPVRDHARHPVTHHHLFHQVSGERGA